MHSSVHAIPDLSAHVHCAHQESAFGDGVGSHHTLAPNARSHAIDRTHVAAENVFAVRGLQQLDCFPVFRIQHDGVGCVLRQCSLSDGLAQCVQTCVASGCTVVSSVVARGQDAGQVAACASTVQQLVFFFQLQTVCQATVHIALQLWSIVEHLARNRDEVSQSHHSSRGQCEGDAGLRLGHVLTGRAGVLSASVVREHVFFGELDQVAGGAANRQHITDGQDAVGVVDDARHACGCNQGLVLACSVNDGSLELHTGKLAATLGHGLESIALDELLTKRLFGLLAVFFASSHLALKFQALVGQFASLGSEFFHCRLGFGFDAFDSSDFAVGFFHPGFQFLGGGEESALGFGQGFDFIDVRHGGFL